jgi:hypothetical protein
MNPNNYCTLEAAKRLVEAGIVIDTDFYHVKHLSGGYWQQSIRSKNELLNIPIENVAEVLPAPSMAEVWRELPETALQPCRDITTGYCHEYLSLQKDGDLTVAGYGEYSEIGRNPTDALIDLLIWVKKEADHD